MNILIDLDGVLTDFFSCALAKLNKALNKKHLAENYVIQYGEFDMAKFFGITTEAFWEILERDDDFWCNLQPFSWSKELFNWLEEKGEVTICTSPSHHSKCAGQKIEWVEKHLGVKNTSLMIGGRKHLMSRRGNFLIDDWSRNTKEFEAHGSGQAILVPSNWNTNGLTSFHVRKAITKKLPI